MGIFFLIKRALPKSWKDTPMLSRFLIMGLLLIHLPVMASNECSEKLFSWLEAGKKKSKVYKVCRYSSLKISENCQRNENCLAVKAYLTPVEYKDASAIGTRESAHCTRFGGVTRAVEIKGSQGAS